MAKLSLNDITSTSSSSIVTQFNANMSLIEAALENTLSRDGTSPNTMSANLDMNSNRIINLVDATTDQEPVTLSQMTEELEELEETVSAIASTAQGYANAAEAALDSFDDRYLGAKASAPTTDNDGGVLSTGTLYFNTTTGFMYVWDGDSWENFEGPTGPSGTTGDFTISVFFDGSTVPLTTGVKADIEIPFGCTITDWTLIADQSGSLVIDIWNNTYENYPPTVSDTITGAAKPTLSSAVKNQSSDLSLWTPAISAGRILRFNIDSVTSVTRATLSLTAHRTA